jgi:hypothetical protein
VTWTGFSGAEIVGFFGELTKLVMNVENPDFFLRTPDGFCSLPSSEKRFPAIVVPDDDVSTLGPNDFSFTRVSAFESEAEKLVD